MRVNYYNIGKRETPKARYEVGTQHDSDNILNLIFFIIIVASWGIGKFRLYGDHNRDFLLIRFRQVKISLFRLLIKFM